MNVIFDSEMAVFLKPGSKIRRPFLTWSAGSDPLIGPFMA